MNVEPVFGFPLETFLGTCHTSMMEIFKNIVNAF